MQTGQRGLLVEYSPLGTMDKSHHARRLFPPSMSEIVPEANHHQPEKQLTSHVL